MTVNGINELEMKEASKAIEKLLEDKKVAEIGEFRDLANKSEGVSSGFKAKRDKDGHQFMLKTFHTGGNLNNRQKNDNISFVNEFVMAPFYKRWLYDSTPHIELVKDKQTGAIYLRSKYLNEFESLQDYLVLNGDTPFLQIPGIERKFAADIMGAELDRHEGNTCRMNTNGSEKTAGKIDHGQSAMNTFTSYSQMWMNFSSYMEKTTKYAKSVSINPALIRDSLDQMLQISDEEIERFAASRVHILKMNGIDFKQNNLNLVIFENSTKHFDASHSKTITIHNEKEAVDHYIKLIKQNMKVVQEFKENILDVISKFDMPEKWFKRNKWITEIGQKDPLLWAIENNVTIEGKKAEVWAKDNNKKINSMEPSKWAKENGKKAEADSWKAKVEANKENVNNRNR